jgi:mono/diheme cytochrome c family protein
MRFCFALTLIGGFAAVLVGGFALSKAIAAQESKQIAEGRGHYEETCKLCHGADGQRGEGFQTPIWGAEAKIASKFVTVQGFIDYMQLMPFNDPTLLDETQKLAVVAFVLSMHGAIKPTDTLDASKAANTPIK